MKVRDCFELNPLKNKNTFKDFINYIDTSSVQNGTLINVSFLENEFPSRAQRIVKYNDILYSSVRPNLRHYYLYQDDFEHAIASTGFVLLRRKNNCNVKFIFYYLSTNEVVKHLSNIAEMSQSTFPSFSSKDLGKIDLPMIDEYKQKSIVDILACYDSLIENNNKRIKVLEQMAEHLYKEWFVRFRFPGHENTEFENGIPKGWTIKKLSEISSFTYGKMPDSAKYVEDGYPIFSGYRITGYYDCYMYDEPMLVLIARGVGGTGEVKVSPPFAYITNLAIVFLLFKPKLHLNYLYRLFSIQNLRYLDTGAAQSQITIENLKNVRVIIPPEEHLIEYNTKAEMIKRQIDAITKTNDNLIKQRDLLLPRLMSGKLEV